MNNFTSSSIENLLEYEKLGFQTQPLGEVVSYLECLHQEDKPLDSMALQLNQDEDNKQQIFAKWNNVKTIARMKNLL